MLIVYGILTMRYRFVKKRVSRPYPSAKISQLVP